MNQALRVLIVEDSEDDVTLLLHTLRSGGYEVVHSVVDTPDAMRTALERQDWDVITSDHAMPHFSAPASLALAKELRPYCPFIIVSGDIDLNLGVSLMKEGAKDFIPKRELPRLVPAIERELREAESRRQRKQVEEETITLLTAVQEEKIKLFALIDSMADEVWFADTQKRFTIANPSALKQFCIDPNQIIEVESLAKSLVVLRPDGSERPVEEAPPLRALLGEVVMNQEELIRIPASGEFRYRQVNASPVRDSAGNIIGSVSVVRDITERKKAEKQLQDSLESLRRAVGTTIQVMVSAVEIRDPYTSGHQLRSADLARAIATEIGLPLEKVEGLRMAASIHDIGKLSIPAEILSKPTKLTAIEFSLIKEHSRNGYEMLKDVESPWPLAEIVYQHHERMDGSGYPRKLKGDEILMEARIMAVADVVESMASHRPYRPALGIDAALNEIEKNRGTHYDNAVADACLRLFREKGFQLDGI